MPKQNKGNELDVAVYYYTLLGLGVNLPERNFDEVIRAVASPSEKIASELPENVKAELKNELLKKMSKKMKQKLGWKY